MKFIQQSLERPCPQKIIPHSLPAMPAAPCPQETKALQAAGQPLFSLPGHDVQKTGEGLKLTAGGKVGDPGSLSPKNTMEPDTAKEV